MSDELARAYEAHREAVARVARLRAELERLRAREYRDPVRDPVALLLAAVRDDTEALAGLLKPWTRASLLAPLLVAAVDAGTRAAGSPEAFEELLAEYALELAAGGP